jgi:Cytochrome C oxidase, cbb3-type, subunit III
MRRELRLLACLVVLALPATAGAFPWSTDMFTGRSVQPLEVPPRNMPRGVLPVHGGEPPMSREEAAVTLKNPLQPTAKMMKHAKELFRINCAPCHGDSGQGNGPVHKQTLIPPADLTAGQPAQRSDGYIYATIRNGSIVMPAYGDATSSKERWELVLYVRKLQGKLPVAEAGQ